MFTAGSSGVLLSFVWGFGGGEGFGEGAEFLYVGLFVFAGFCKG